MIWNPAGKSTMNQLPDWLRNEEWKHVNLSSLLKNQTRPLTFNSLWTKRLWIRGDSQSIEGCLFLSDTGMLFPDFDENTLEETELIFLSKFLLTWKSRLYAIMGMQSRVALMEKLLKGKASEVVDYRMMVFSDPKSEPLDVRLSPTQKIFKALPQNAEALWHLEKGYRVEESLREGHSLNKKIVLNLFRKTLKEHMVYCISINGYPVAKANTNARGWIYDQIGGVYVDPAFRKQGLGQIVMNILVNSILKEGRIPCLFVKETNHTAIRLYNRIGFSEKGLFRISYWD